MVVLNLPGASFLEEVERLVREEGLSYMDSVLAWCEKRNIEVESMSSVIAGNSVLRAKIQLEAENLHFLPKSTRTAL